MTLKDSMAADLDTFVNPDEFGVSAVFSRTGLTINILLEKEPDPETGVFIDLVMAKLSDVPGVVMGDTFTVGSSVYRVVSSKPEPMGELMGMLRVEK